MGRHIDAFRKAMDAFNRGDDEPFFALVDTDVVCHAPSGDLVGKGALRAGYAAGRAGGWNREDVVSGAEGDGWLVYVFRLGWASGAADSVGASSVRLNAEGRWVEYWYHLGP